MWFSLPAVERAMTIQDVMTRAMSGEYSWLQAAEILGMSPRSLLRWRGRYERKGYDGLLDRRRCVPSRRRAPLAEVERVLRLYRETYQGFNGRHFHEIARREHGVTLSYSFVKKALQTAGLMRKYRPRGRHRRRREPRACFGEMLHIDGSPHAWLARVPEQRQVFIGVVDDATSHVLFGQLFESESAWAVMVALDAVVRKHGVPASVYSDRAGWAVYTPKAGGPYDPERLTQVGRAFRRLGVEHILAYSPQARGRSERLNRTFQGRLVNELRLAGIDTLPEANRYLGARFLPTHNTTFSRSPRDPQSAFVPLGRVDLDQVFCHEEPRMVGRDNTVCLDGIRMQLDKQPGRRTCAGLHVVLRRHLDGTHSVWHGPRRLGTFDAKGQARRVRPVEAAGPVDAGKRAHKDLGRLLNPAGVHSSHKATATTAL